MIGPLEAPNCEQILMQSKYSKQTSDISTWTAILSLLRQPINQIKLEVGDFYETPSFTLSEDAAHSRVTLEFIFDESFLPVSIQVLEDLLTEVQRRAPRYSGVRAVIPPGSLAYAPWARDILNALEDIQGRGQKGQAELINSDTHI